MKKLSIVWFLIFAVFLGCNGAEGNNTDDNVSFQEIQNVETVFDFEDLFPFDSDNDGVDDCNGPPDDCDGDGLLNEGDPDIDGDGILNGEDLDPDGDDCFDAECENCSCTGQLSISLLEDEDYIGPYIVYIVTVAYISQMSI